MREENVFDTKPASMRKYEITPEMAEVLDWAERVVKYSQKEHRLDLTMGDALRLVEQEWRKDGIWPW